MKSIRISTLPIGMFLTFSEHSGVTDSVVSLARCGVVLEEEEEEEEEEGEEGEEL